MDFQVLDFEEAHVRRANKIETSSGNARDLYRTSSRSLFAATSRSAARTVAAIFSRLVYFSRPSLAISSVPSSDLRVKLTSVARPLPRKGLRTWLAVRFSRPVSENTNAPESPTLAPMIPLSDKITTTHVASPKAPIVAISWSREVRSLFNDTEFKSDEAIRFLTSLTMNSAASAPPPIPPAPSATTKTRFEPHQKNSARS